jgi:hypothetical protein
MWLGLPKNILLFLWKPNVHQRVHKRPPVYHIFSHLNPVRTIVSYLRKFQTNVVRPPTSMYSQWSPGYGKQPKTCKQFSNPHECHMFRLPHPPSWNHPNNIRWRLQVWISSLRNFPHDPSRFLSFPNITLNTLSSNPQSMFLPQSERPSFAPIQKNWPNCSFDILIFKFFDMRREDKRFWTE